MPKARKKTGNRSIEKRLFIVCEGMADKSESAYFKSLIKDCNFAGDKVVVSVKDTNKNTGKELVKEAIKIKEFPFDQAWVVYDMDGYTKHADTFSLARNKDINIAFTAIAFEFWLLLHFEFTSKSFSKSEEIIKYLKQKGYIDYSKGNSDIYCLTKKNVGDAIHRAKKLRKSQISATSYGTPIYKMNPYTNIDELIELIFSYQKKK